MEATNNYSSIFKQPKAFYVIFMLEIWERLLYAGIMATIAVFLIKELKMDQNNSAQITGSFGALCYGLIVIGGKLGDKWFGIKRSILLGLIFILCGFLSLYYSVYLENATHISVNDNFVYFSLALYIIGTALFKPNPSNLLSLYYPPHADLDSVYTYYYMAINFGALIGGAIAPFIAVQYGYLPSFIMLIIASFLSIISFAIGYLYIKERDNHAGQAKFGFKKVIISIICIIASTYLVGMLLKYNSLANIFLYLLFFMSLIYFIYLIKSAPSKNIKNRLIAALALILQYMLFFILYIQVFSSLTFFGLSNCNLTLGPITFNEQQFSTFDSIAVILLSPILAIWYKKHDSEHSYVTKFSLGNIGLGLSFIILYASSFFADANYHVSIIWTLLAFIVFAGGELLISAVGLSMIADLIDKNHRGFAYGFWFITGALGIKIGGKLAGIFSIKEGVNNPAVTLHMFSNLFLLLGSIVTVIGLITCIFIPKLKQILRSHS